MSESSRRRGPRFVLAGCLTLAATAHGSNGLETPDIGTVNLGRGGAAFLALDDGLVAFFNPARLASLSSSVHVGGSLIFSSQCFTRLGEDGQPVSPGNDIPGPGADGGPGAEVCSEHPPFVNPQLAGNVRITDRIGVGLSVAGPHGIGTLSWPESISYSSNFGDRTQPAPQRYMLVERSSALVFPTLSVGVQVLDKAAHGVGLSLGAGFIWGISTIRSTSFVESTSAGENDVAADDFFRSGNGDVQVNLDAKDLFVPGFVVSAMAETTVASDRNLEFGAWFRWQDDIRAGLDAELHARYWQAGGTPDSAAQSDEFTTNAKDAGTMTIAIPMEAKVGVRYAKRRPGAMVASFDPLATDEYDIELDVTWANNSSFEALEVAFEGDVDVQGTPGQLPNNSSVPHNWKDVVGARLGGSFVVMPSRLALRAGGFFETAGQAPEDLHVDFHMGPKLGLGLGGTVRIGPVDLSAAYQHTFFFDLDNGGEGNLLAASGDQSAGQKSRQTVNGGKLSGNMNELALGATVRF